MHLGCGVSGICFSFFLSLFSLSLPLAVPVDLVQWSPVRGRCSMARIVFARGVGQSEHRLTYMCVTTRSWKVLFSESINTGAPTHTRRLAQLARVEVTASFFVVWLVKSGTCNPHVADVVRCRGGSLWQYGRLESYQRRCHGSMRYTMPVCYVCSTGWIDTG